MRTCIQNGTGTLFVCLLLLRTLPEYTNENILEIKQLMRVSTRQKEANKLALHKVPPCQRERGVSYISAIDLQISN